MGIARFYRWLGERYPLMLTGENDPARPNFDNLYIDGNGVVHPCVHPVGNKDRLHDSLSYREMFDNLFRVIDHLVDLVRPRKRLFIALDGVAPRAKMNQQRARRFRSAFESDMQAQEMEEAGMDEVEDPFDSNCITPGTDFMQRLTAHIIYYIQKRLSNNEAWRHLEVVFSGADAPGEGEHKIMEFIRTSPGSKDESHIVHGMDADLILLLLATHHPRTAVLREIDIPPPKFGRGRRREKKPDTTAPWEKKHKIIYIGVLREMLLLDFKSMKMPKNIEFDLERLIDDFVLICIFVGNDFLPHLPGMDIAEGAMDRLLSVYKDKLHKFGGYLVSSPGTFDLDRLKALFVLFGVEFELAAFKGPKEADVLQKRASRLATNMKNAGSDMPEAVQKAKGAFAVLEGLTEDNVPKDFSGQISKKGKKGPTKKGPTSASADDIYRQMLREAEASYKAEYYGNKFKILAPNRFLTESAASKSELEVNRQNHLNLIQSYMEGICWVLLYYYGGCKSWTWFFPYHFAPLMSDLAVMDPIEVVFQPDKPARPFEQLLSVLPPQSKDLLIPELGNLMTMEASPLKSYYPFTIEMDKDGKKVSWLWIPLLPFVDLDLLQASVRVSLAKADMTELEVLRNTFNRSIKFEYSKELVAPFKISEDIIVDKVAFPELVEGNCSWKYVNREYWSEGTKAVSQVVLPVPSPAMVPWNRVHRYIAGYKTPSDGVYPTVVAVGAPKHEKLIQCGVNVFGNRARGLTFQIAFSRGGPNIDKKSLASLMKKDVMFGWPFGIRGKPIAIYSPRVVVDEAGPRNSHKRDVDLFNSCASKIYQNLYKNRGVLLHAQAILEVQPYPMDNREVSRSDLYSVREGRVFVPIELCSPASGEAVAVKDKPIQPGDQAVWISHTKPERFGNLCTVVSADDGIDVLVIDPQRESQDNTGLIGSTNASYPGGKQPNLYESLARQRQTPLEWFTGNSICKLAGVQYPVFQLLTTCLTVRTPDRESINIGFDLHRRIPTQYLCGLAISKTITLKNSNGQERVVFNYSNDTLSMIRGYIMRFPVILQQLAEFRRSDRKFLEFFDIFPEMEGGDHSRGIEKLKEARSYVESCFDSKDPTYVLSDGLCMEPQIQAVMSKEIDAFVHEKRDLQTVPISGANAGDLLIAGSVVPRELRPRVPGDRVVFVGKKRGVGFGMKGTLLSIDRSGCDVAWDSETEGGKGVMGSTKQCALAVASAEVLSISDDASQMWSDLHSPGFAYRRVVSQPSGVPGRRDQGAPESHAEAPKKTAQPGAASKSVSVFKSPVVKQISKASKGLGARVRRYVPVPNHLSTVGQIRVLRPNRTEPETRTPPAAAPAVAEPARQPAPLQKSSPPSVVRKILQREPPQLAPAPAKPGKPAEQPPLVPQVYPGPAAGMEGPPVFMGMHPQPEFGYMPAPQMGYGLEGWAQAGQQPYSGMGYFHAGVPMQGMGVRPGSEGVPIPLEDLFGMSQPQRGAVPAVSASNPEPRRSHAPRGRAGGRGRGRGRGSTHYVKKQAVYEAKGDPTSLVPTKVPVPQAKKEKQASLPPGPSALSMASPNFK